MTINTIEVTQLIPSEGMHLQNIKTGKVFPKRICIPKSLTADDFTEITEDEYQAIKQAELEESEEVE